MIDFQDLLELAQLRAIHLALEPTLDSVYRIKCREYSVRFNTPLHTVIEDLDPLFVFQTLYEDQYHPSIVGEELDELLEKLYTMKDPTYSKISKEDMEELVDSVLQKEMDRASKKKRPTQETIQDDINKSAITVPIAKKPRQGGLSFSELEKADSKIEKGEF